jgi:hypothetical protein
MSDTQQGPVPMEGGERASADNGAGVASRATTAGALTGAAAGAIGLGAVTGACQQQCQHELELLLLYICVKSCK